MTPPAMTPPTSDDGPDPRAILAAQNNADWYEMMFTVHGLRYERSPHRFLARDQPPAYHSRMLILDPAPDPGLLAQVAAEAAKPGFGAKDAHCSLDLDSPEFNHLVEFFTAQWIWAAGGFSTAVNLDADTTGWVRITDEANLEVWDRAWADGGSPTDNRQFPQPILTRDDVAIWGRRSRAGFDAGAIANLSVDHSGAFTCVGLSNVFGPHAMAAAGALCARFGNGAPVVGYESGEALEEAKSAGFEAVGQLRICGRPDRSVRPD